MISGEKSKLPDVLARVRKEKDALEKENAELQQRANATTCENERLRDQISVFQDELMVSSTQVSGIGPNVHCLLCRVVILLNLCVALWSFYLIPKAFSPLVLYGKKLL